LWYDLLQWQGYIGHVSPPEWAVGFVLSNGPFLSLGGDYMWDSGDTRKEWVAEWNEGALMADGTPEFITVYKD